MKSKTTVIKHGKLFMPPPSVVSVVCPECGKSWSGYDNYDDKALKKSWNVSKGVTCKKPFPGVTIIDRYNTFDCPECGCAFKSTDADKCARIISSGILRFLRFESVLCVIISAVSACLSLEKTGRVCTEALIFLIIGVICLAILLGLCAFDTRRTDQKFRNTDNPMYRIGDKVVLIDGRLNDFHNTGWVKEMDEFIGKTFVITDFRRNPKHPKYYEYRINDRTEYVYDEAWLMPY